MGLVLALAGWVLAVGASAAALSLRSRLEAVARAEHELRGPVAVLCLACERMRREPAARRHAAALDTELVRLQAGLADLAAARRGQAPRVEAETVDLGRFARSSLDGWRASLRDAGRDARVDWRAGRARVVADPGRLAQALGNLVANAAEHGDGPVEVRGRRVNGAVRVEVRNAERGGGERGASGRDAERGRGLDIAERAAASAGGRVDVTKDGEQVVASLELPDVAA